MAEGGGYFQNFDSMSTIGLQRIVSTRGMNYLCIGYLASSYVNQSVISNKVEAYSRILKRNPCCVQAGHLVSGYVKQHLPILLVQHLSVGPDAGAALQKGIIIPLF